MNKYLFLFILVFIIGSLYVSNLPDKNISPSPQSATITSANPDPSGQEKTKIIAQNLDTPWGIVFLPDGKILVTQRSGLVSLIENGEIKTVAELTRVKEVGEGGLLGLALHPDFPQNNFVYFYYTYDSKANGTLNRVVRMNFKDDKLTDEKIIVDIIPGASNHNGGRIKFGPDGFLYITTGDAQDPSRSQDKNSLAGKILRVTFEGKPAPGNPFGNLVFSYGHRNSQGLAWDSTGRLWATEHGRSGLQSGLDELNLIESGKNYGWPDIQGDEKKSGMVSPEVHSGSDTWAPAGAALIDNSIFFSGLRGSALYKYDLSPKKLEEFFKNEFGRIRDVVAGPDGMLYISTSNLDGRGTPQVNDDKIIRINPALLP